jgi:hypothetical protein
MADFGFVPNPVIRKLQDNRPISTLGSFPSQYWQK